MNPKKNQRRRGKQKKTYLFCWMNSGEMALYERSAGFLCLQPSIPLYQEMIQRFFLIWGFRAILSM